MITSELVELPQNYAVKHLTAFRLLEARDFGSVVTIVTTDFEALYAYKRGDYQRCLELSSRIVRMYRRRCVFNVPAYPEFIQLLDDDIVSLTALTLIVDPNCRTKCDNASITQITLTLYLMTQCQLKLRHSMTSLAQTINYIKVAQKIFRRKRTLDHLTLKLTY